MTTTATWFDVDRLGLQKLLERRGKAWAIFELIQNCWDTNAKRVQVKLQPVEGAPQVWLTVEDDDPDGFRDLTHAFTLFAESGKKGDPTKRGRFNLGCKLVLALCHEATVASTTGAVRFDATGRHTLRQRRAAGSMFHGRLKLTREELATVEGQLYRLLAPEGIETIVRIERAGGAYTECEIQARQPDHVVDATLPTEIADAEGYLRNTQRKTVLRLFATVSGEAWLYELGIPVQPIDGPWHVDVMQKIPLGLERDSVSPAFIRRVQTLVANAAAHLLPPAEFTAPWLAEVVQDANVEPLVVERYLRAKYGDRCVIDVPGAEGRESGREAVAAGYTLIRGGSEAGATWDKIKAHGLVQKATTLFPPPAVSNDWHELPLDEQPAGYHAAVRYAVALAERLLGLCPLVRVISGPTIHAASWQRSRQGQRAVLTFNVAKLGAAWFDDGPTPAVNALLIHEFAHEFGDHLEEAFDDALARLGAEMVELALREARFFIDYASPSYVAELVG